MQQERLSVKYFQNIAQLFPNETDLPYAPDDAPLMLKDFLTNCRLDLLYFRQ